MDLPEQVRIVEVGPRDGLQNEPATQPVDLRAAFVDALAATGLRHIEVGAFVSPRRVPQMADAAAVFAAIRRRPDVTYRALVPNLRGFDDAVAAGVDEIAVFGASSEAFSQRNIRASIDESFRRFAAVTERARARDIPTRAYVSCALGCPFQGPVPPADVAAVARRFHEMGCYEVVVSDTTGVGTPLQVLQVLDAVTAHVPLAAIAVHFHDTYGQALPNILAALQRGVTTYDSAVAGLGGCPYSPGARGNVATEDLVYMLDGLGIAHGVDLDALVAVAADFCARIGRDPASRVTQAMRAACAVDSS